MTPKRRRRGAVLVTQFYAPEQMGTAFYTQDLASTVDAWCGAGVVAGEPYYPEFEKYADYRKGRPREILNGLPILRVRTLVPRPGSAASRLLSDVNFLIRGAIRVRRLDIKGSVVSFAPGTAPVLIGSLLRAPGRRHVVIVHDIQSGLASGTGLLGGRLVKRALGAVEAWSLSRATDVAVLSDQMATELAALGVDRHKMFVLPIWLREDLWKGFEPQELCATPIAMYSGSLGGKQGVERFVGLAAELERKRIPGRIVVRGAGPTAEALLGAAEDLPAGRLVLEPLVREDALPRALAEAWVHVLPQRSGVANFSVPSKVLNVLAAGRPLVAETDAASPLEDLGRRCSAVITTPVSQPGKFEAAVADLLTDQGRCAELGREARRYVMEHHSKDAVLRSLKDRMVDGLI